MSKENKNVKNLKINEENKKKSLKSKLTTAVCIIGTVIIVGGSIGIHSVKEKSEKENHLVNEYLSSITSSSSVDDLLKPVQIEDIEDWLEISEDSYKYEDKVKDTLKDHTDYELNKVLEDYTDLDTYKKAVQTFEGLDAKPSLSKEEEQLKIETAIIIGASAQKANESLSTKGYDFITKLTLTALKKDCCSHLNIDDTNLNKIEITPAEEELSEPKAYVSDTKNDNSYVIKGYVARIAVIVSNAQSASTGSNEVSSVFDYNEERIKAIKEAYDAYKLLNSGITEKSEWEVKEERQVGVTSKRYKCETPSYNSLAASSKEANLTEGRNR